MPVYTMECPAGHREYPHRSFDESNDDYYCDLCDEKMHKVYSSPTVHAPGGFFKDTYQTHENYRRREAARLRKVGKDPKDHLIGDPDKGIPLG